MNRPDAQRAAARRTLVRRLALPVIACLAAAVAASLPEPVLAQTYRPELSINIPDLSFASIKPDNNAGYVDIPWIAQYVSAIMRYSLFVAGLAASVMFMVGGFQVLTAGGASDRVMKGKERIVNALIGVVLVLLSYTMLRTVNPELVDGKLLRIRTIVRDEFEVISPSNMIAATGRPAIPQGEMTRIIRTKAKETGGADFDCFVYASVVHESGGKQDAIGHDENHRSTQFSITARRRFQNSGKTYKGVAFTPANCNDKSCQGQGPINDDVSSFNIAAPPEYGLDWRFSHGFGAGQSTVFPESAPCPGRPEAGRGFQRGGKCYTIPELLDPVKQAEAMVDHYRSCWNRTRNGELPALGYVCYQGQIEVDNPQITKRVAVYERCKAGLR
jgi:hypothetical protein